MQQKCNANARLVPWGSVRWGLQEVPFEGPLRLMQYRQPVGILHAPGLHKGTAVTHFLPPFDMSSCHSLLE